MRAVILNLFLINLIFAQTYRLEGEILDASEDGGIESMKALGKQKAKEYKKGWDYITKNIESGEPQEAPIAIRDKNNELYLMAGNTRLMSNTAYGRKIPLKVIEYDGEFKSSKDESVLTKEWKNQLKEQVATFLLFCFNFLFKVNT